MPCSKVGIVRERFRRTEGGAQQDIALGFTDAAPCLSAAAGAAHTAAVLIYSARADSCGFSNALVAMHSRCRPVHSGDWQTCEATWDAEKFVLCMMFSRWPRLMPNQGCRAARSSSTPFRRRLNIG